MKRFNGKLDFSTFPVKNGSARTVLLCSVVDGIPRDSQAKKTWWHHLGQSSMTSSLKGSSSACDLCPGDK